MKIVRLLWISFFVSGCYASTTLEQPAENIVSHPIISVATGRDHACTIDAMGAVRCWGSGADGRLGTGRLDSFDSPQLVVGIDGHSAASRAIDVAAGRSSTCALMNNASIRCWGSGAHGQLGSGDMQSQSLPTPVQTFEGNSQHERAKAVSVGVNNACAITENGAAKCWGALFGASPTQLEKLDGSSPELRAVQVAVGHHRSCVLTENGAVSCWSFRGSGLNLDERNALEHVAGLDGQTPASRATHIAVGWDQACAIVEDGNIKCWGNNYYGQLGNGTFDSAERPQTVGFFEAHPNARVVDLSLAYQSCALLENGGLLCWGSGEDGALGIAGFASQSTPQWVPAFDPTASSNGASVISTGDKYTCSINREGSVECWGYVPSAADRSRRTVRVAHEGSSRPE